MRLGPAVVANTRTKTSPANEPIKGVDELFFLMVDSRLITEFVLLIEDGSRKVEFAPGCPQGRTGEPRDQLE